jgi:repressor LexA
MPVVRGEAGFTDDQAEVLRIGTPPTLGCKSCRATMTGYLQKLQPDLNPLAYNRAAVTKKPYTAKQGQYLAFIFYYTKIHGFAPAESDMQNYFKVTPPSVHQMVLTLEASGFITRVPGLGRSIRLLTAREDLPDLE